MSSHSLYSELLDELVSQPAANPFLPLSRVPASSVRWLWPGRIPLGKLTVFDGDPGLGKSTVLLDLAARLTTGHPMPDADLPQPPLAESGPLPTTPSTVAPSPSSVVLLSAEDALADTVRPRLEAAGADLDHVVALPYLPPGGERPLRLPVDIPLLAQLVRQLQARLLVVDPLLAFLSLRASVGNDQSIRAALAPLALLAERLECAVVLVRHLTKHTSRNSLYRGSGSIGLIGLARAGLLVAPDPDDPAGARRVLASTKSNLGPTAPSLAYRLVAAPTGATAIAWDGPVHHSAASLFAPPTDQREATVLGEAMAVLAAILADGPVDAALVQRQAAQAGLSASALRRARATLGVRSRRVSPPGQAGPGWVWELPFHPPAPH